MSFTIKGTGSALPRLVVTNDDLSRIVDTSDEWITTRTGVKERRVLSEETLTDLALEAAEKAMADAGVKPEELDFILCATIRGDVISPSMGCLLQGRLGAGCPAMDIMKKEVIDTLVKYGVTNPEVEISFKRAWTSDMISDKGKMALKKFGLAPPPDTNTIIDDLSVLEHAECPRCHGINTEMKSPFGPTLCRSLHYCNDCREAFEQFKPL